VYAQFNFHEYSSKIWQLLKNDGRWMTAFYDKMNTFNESRFLCARNLSIDLSKNSNRLTPFVASKSNLQCLHNSMFSNFCRDLSNFQTATDIRWQHFVTKRPYWMKRISLQNSKFFSHLEFFICGSYFILSKKWLLKKWMVTSNHSLLPYPRKLNSTHIVYWTKNQQSCRTVAIFWQRIG